MSRVHGKRFECSRCTKAKHDEEFLRPNATTITTLQKNNKNEYTLTLYPLRNLWVNCKEAFLVAFSGISRFGKLKHALVEHNQPTVLHLHLHLLIDNAFASSQQKGV